MRIFTILCSVTTPRHCSGLGGGSLLSLGALALSKHERHLNSVNCADSVRIAGGLELGVQPPLNVFNPLSCACLCVLGSDVNPTDRSYRKILNFLVNT